METGRTVTLELLRHGPPHNQLISPITQYLALCGNHPATTLQLPFEHKQLLNHLNALEYKGRGSQDEAETREFQLQDTGELMGEILAEVPGLIAELAGSTSPEDQLTHLRLILSASELALLPFELANSPNGFPGAGQNLALQAQMPLCITREVRRVGNEHFHWPDTPTILFIAAAPDGVAPIPLESHLLALRKVIDPWVRYYDENDPADFKKKIEEHLVVLPHADVDQIQAACASCGFTHVHVLAHGVEMKKAGENRYGLALHSTGGRAEPDTVDGARLATLLRTPDRQGRMCGPAVVTLASCESANQGSVVGAGASIAHALHEAGIPLVVGSQFPLSFQASVLLVEVLYERLLRGADPRALLYELRMQLKSRVKETHDWASLVVYAALPPTLGAQLSQVRMTQARRSINAAMDHADSAIRTLSLILQENRRPGSTPPPGLPLAGSSPAVAVNETSLAEARRKIEAAKQWLAQVAPATPEEQAKIHALLASTNKREAEILFRAGRGTTETAQWTTLLSASRDEYRKTFEADMSSNWALVQDLVLTAVLEGPEQVSPEKWVTACTLAEMDLYHQDQKRVAWAHGSLIELHLLALVMAPSPFYPAPEPACKTAEEHAQKLNRVRERSEIYTTRRQILRYVEWFGVVQPGMAGLRATAQKIFYILWEGDRFSRPRPAPGVFAAANA
jgi:hypothetical protein